jgi:hypothetical protein
MGWWTDIAHCSNPFSIKRKANKLQTTCTCTSVLGVTLLPLLCLMLSCKSKNVTRDWMRKFCMISAEPLRIGKVRDTSELYV